MTDQQTVTVNEACATVGVSRRTIYNWIAQGKVSVRRTAGGSIRIVAASLWRDQSPKQKEAPACD